MQKARLLLGLVMALLGYGFYAIWQSDMVLGSKIVLTGLGSILSNSALILFLSTLFVLDSEGKIARDSLLYKYLDRFVYVGLMPKSVKLCPLYWMVACHLSILYLTVSVLIMAVSLVMSGTLFLLGLFSAIIIFAGVITLILEAIQRSTSYGKKAFWFTLLVLVILGVLMGTPLYRFIVIDEMTLSEALWQVFFYVFIFAGSVIGLFMLLGTLFGVSWLVMMVLPFFRNSFFGKIASGLYGRLCPIIPIEQKGGLGSS